MIEQKVLRLGCSPEEVAQRFRERAQQALCDGDSDKFHLFMQFVPKDVSADVPETPPPSDIGDSW
jgi:hypothetical protein